MAKTSKRGLRQIDPNIISALRQEILQGEYRLYMSPSQLPPGLTWGGSQFDCSVWAASSLGGSNAANQPSFLQPQGEIYLWQGYRSSTGGSSPHKTDYCLYWQDASGNAWSDHSKSASEHHNNLVSTSGLEGLIRDNRLPSASAGKTASFVKTICLSSKYFDSR